MASSEPMKRTTGGAPSRALKAMTDSTSAAAEDTAPWGTMVASKDSAVPNLPDTLQKTNTEGGSSPTAVSSEAAKGSRKAKGESTVSVSGSGSYAATQNNPSGVGDLVAAAYRAADKALVEHLGIRARESHLRLPDEWAFPTPRGICPPVYIGPGCGEDEAASGQADSNCATNSICIQYHDVLLSGCKIAQQHPGNFLLAILCKKNSAEYKSLPSKDDKSRYVYGVLNKVFTTGGRFLQRTPYGTWEVVPIDEVKDKVQRRLLRPVKEEPDLSAARPDFIGKPLVIVNSNVNEDEFAQPTVRSVPTGWELGALPNPGSTKTDSADVGLSSPATVDDVKEVCNDANDTAASALASPSDSATQAQPSSARRVSRRKKSKPIPNASGSSLTTTSWKTKRTSYTIVDRRLDVEGLHGDSKLTLWPGFLTASQSAKLCDNVLHCKELVQYRRRVHEEPRLHLLLHRNASSKDSDIGVGYTYHDVHMKARPLDTIPGMDQLSSLVAAKLGVPEWRIGVDVIVYTCSADGIGWHADSVVHKHL